MQRAVVFAEAVGKEDPSNVALFFSAVCVGPGQSKEPAAIVLAEAAFLSLVYGHWSADHQRYTREAAAYVDDEVTLCFLVAPESTEESEESFQIPKYSDERVLTLGERKALASTPSRKKMETAMRDPHPMVAQKLLDNPKLTEDDVVRICASASMAPSVLAKIAIHVKWRRQRIVQKALVNNKRLPADFAITLLPFLNQRSLREVSFDARLHADVQRGAQVLLAAIDRSRCR